MNNARLSIRNLGKSYSTPVLIDVNLSVVRGEIHAIVGENGAGKSTLVNILAGFVQPDNGEIYLDGLRYNPSGPKEAFAAGISCAAQELSIIGTLTLAENLFLRKLPQKNFFVLNGELNQTAKQLMKLVGLQQESPDTLAEQLSLADQQLLELAKALASDCRLLILDEPTSALAGHQVDRLHEIIKGIAAAGTSVIYISHRLDDVLDVSDTITVLRDGQVVASLPTSTTSVPDLVDRMIGKKNRDTGDLPPAWHRKTPVLEAVGITTTDLPNPISLTLHEGEIVGIAGLAGSGRSELLEALFGLDPLKGGSVRRCTESGKISIRSASHAVKVGIGFLPEDRQSMGLFAGKSVLTNITLPGLRRLASTLGLVDAKRESVAGSDLATKLDIKCASVRQDIDQLSGGNQQKALIARWLHCDSTIFLFDEPTRGVDVGTKVAIYRLLFEMQRMGKSLLIVSSEIDELMTVCGRILVLSDRKLVKEFERGNWSETEILATAFQEFASGLPRTRSERSVADMSINHN